MFVKKIQSICLLFNSFPYLLLNNYFEIYFFFTNILLAYQKKNSKKIGNNHIILNFLYRFFFLKKLHDSRLNIMSLPEIFSRKNEVIFFRNNRGKIKKILFSFIKNRKKVKKLKIFFFKKNNKYIKFLFSNLDQSLNKKKKFIFNKIIGGEKYFYFQVNLFLSKEISVLKKLIKINFFIFFSYKTENIKSRINTNRDKILFKFLEDLNHTNYIFLWNNEYRFDSLINVKNFNSNNVNASIDFLFNENIMIKKFFFANIKSTESSLFLKNAFKIYNSKNYVLLNFHYFKLFLQKAAPIFETLDILLLFFYNIISNSFNKNFNNFILLFCLKLIITTKNIKKNKNYHQIFYFLFPKMTISIYLNIIQIIKYLEIAFLFLFNLLEQKKEFVKFHLFFFFIIRILKNLNFQNTKESKVIKTIFSYLQLSKIGRNIFYSNVNFGIKKKKILILVKCNKCFLFVLEIFLKNIYQKFSSKQNVFTLLNSIFISNLAKNKYNYKIRHLLHLSIYMIKNKKIKKKKIIFHAKNIIKIIFLFIKNLILISKFYLKNFLNWVKKKLKTLHSFLFLLFLIDNTFFLKFFDKKIRKKTFFFFEKIILNKEQYILIIVFLDKLDIIIQIEEKNLYMKNSLENLLAIYSNSYTLTGPNRNHVLLKKSLNFLQKKILNTIFLKTINDLSIIAIMGISSRYIHTHSIKMLIIKRKKEKNECFQLREIFTNLYTCVSITNILYIKYIFFLYDNFLNNHFLSFQEIYEKFVFLSFFVLNDFTNREIIRFFYFLTQNKSKQNNLNIQRGIKQVIDYVFQIKKKISFKEKLLKNKSIKITIKKLKLFCKIFTNIEEKICNNIAVKFFFYRFLSNAVLEQNFNLNHEIMAFLNDFLNFLKIKKTFSKKMHKMCKSIIILIQIIEKIKIKTIYISNSDKLFFKNWISICNLFFTKIFIEILYKQRTNQISDKKIFYREILDVSELSSVQMKNWKKNIQNIICITRMV
jgi:hypothetical protein